MTGDPVRPESAFLAAGCELLRDPLVRRGFVYTPDAAAVASSGPFATAFFRRGDMEIGLIVRARSRLGCPNYSIGRGYAGHADLTRALGVGGQEELVEGEFLEFRSRTGRDEFVALRADLELLLLPVLDRSEAEFRRAITRAVEDRWSQSEA